MGPDQWDLTCAEHLMPQESYKLGALRGLREEMAIDLPDVQGPLTAPHFRELVIPGRIIDREFVQSFWARGYAGTVDFNAAEVSAVRWVTLEELEEEMKADPESFTEWFRAEYPMVREDLLRALLEVQSV